MCIYFLDVRRKFNFLDARMKESGKKEERKKYSFGKVVVKQDTGIHFPQNFWQFSISCTTRTSAEQQ